MNDNDLADFFRSYFSQDIPYGRVKFKAKSPKILSEDKEGAAFMKEEFKVICDGNEFLFHGEIVPKPETDADRIMLVSTIIPLAEEQFYHIRHEVIKMFPGYKILLLECIDADFGSMAIAKIKSIHDKLHDFIDDLEVTKGKSDAEKEMDGYWTFARKCLDDPELGMKD